MQSRRELNYGGRFPKPKQHSAMANAKTQRRRGVPISKLSRGGQRNEQLPFIPPEDWYEPTEQGLDYRVVVKSPGLGFRHILTPADIRNRLAELPAAFIQNLEVVQLSGMTRKKQSFPCYGMQWGSSLYLYPIEENLIEDYNSPPTPAQRNEARMYGGRWIQESAQRWKLVWNEQSVRDFYLNNILIHELGHLVDARNTRYVDRERYAEWFALEHGYKASRRLAMSGPRAVHRRHHAAKRLA
jgi:hypothetical protein